MYFTLINGHTAKWTYFAIYWIGLPLRKYNSKFASLKIPHSEHIPEFYKRGLNILIEFKNIAPDCDLDNLRCKET